MQAQKIGVIGIGHIGLATALAMAHHHHHVYCVDRDAAKIKHLKDAIPPYFEPGLTAELKQCLIDGRLFFTSQYEPELMNMDVIFIAVDTPSDPQGQADLTGLNNVFQSLEKLRLTSSAKKLPAIVIKSTVPPQTTEKLGKLYPHYKMAFIPEFLREGSALFDSLNPERIIFGTSHSDLIQLLENIFTAFPKEIPRLTMSTTSAEISKYAANTFLAARISLINEFALICDQLNGSIQDVAQAVALDSRIGKDFLKSGIGYGGSCFPKDLQALMGLENKLQRPLQLTRAIHEINTLMPTVLTAKILKYFTAPTTLAVWGVAFKPHTSDIRSSPALKVVHELLNQGFQLNIHDPEGLENFTNYFSHHPQVSNLKICLNKELALSESSGLVILTDWPEYIDFDWLSSTVHQKRTPVFDGRLVLPDRIRSQLNYQAIGWSP